MPKTRKPSYAELEATITDLRQRVAAANTRAAEADKEVKETRVLFVELKDRLLTAEKDLARLNGYLDRVAEDDAVRDGFIEVDTPNGKRHAPKRPPPFVRCAPEERAWDNLLDRDHSRPRRPSWPNY